MIEPLPHCPRRNAVLQQVSPARLGRCGGLVTLAVLEDVFTRCCRHPGRGCLGRISRQMRIARGRVGAEAHAAGNTAGRRPNIGEEMAACLSHCAGAAWTAFVTPRFGRRDRPGGHMQGR